MRWWDEQVLDSGRWRPLVEPAVARIARARDQDRIPQAILMVGPPGLGRELAAVEAAVMLTCPDAPHPWAGGGCSDRVRRGVHPDVAAVLPQPPSLQIKIEQVRAIVDTVAGRPYEGLRRVWIFDGVEAGRLGAEAANAFLKTLEEPPEHARFLLLAANPAAVLPTIRSRCQMLSLPGPPAVAAHLGLEVSPELTAAALAEDDLGPRVSQIRDALRAALDGEVAGLAGLPYLDGNGGRVLEIVAAVAVVMVGEEPDAERAGELARLAADLLATDRAVRALNLSRERQLASCLLRWYREL